MRVAVAIIFNNEQQVLITRRSPHVPHGGLWEFPGGKIEVGELPEEALVREIKEEIAIDILDYHFLGQIVHHYDTKQVCLLVFHVKNFHGEAICNEGQTDLVWVAPMDLNGYEFPAANEKIIELIKDNVPSLVST